MVVFAYNCFKMSDKTTERKYMSVQTPRLNNSGNLHKSKIVIGLIVTKYFRIPLVRGIWGRVHLWCHTSSSWSISDAEGQRGWTSDISVIRETYVHIMMSKYNMRHLAHVWLRLKQEDRTFWRWARHYHDLHCCCYKCCCQRHMWSVYLATTRTCFSCWHIRCIGWRMERWDWTV